MNKLRLAAQLYTLRDEVQNNLPTVFRNVREVGFTGVELAGFGSLKTAVEVRKAADDAGVAFAGSHVPLDALTGDYAKVIQDQHTLGNRDVVVPWLPEDRRKTAADWLSLSDTLNGLGHQLAKDGLRLGYHNHAFEFDLFDGQTGMNLLLQHTDPAVVGFEVDVYWVAHAKHDPVQFLTSLGSRLRLVHLKDAAKDGKFAAVGTGTLDFPKITRTAQDAGVEWGIVEQDDCYGQTPIDVLRTGYDNLKRLGFA